MLTIEKLNEEQADLRRRSARMVMRAGLIGLAAGAACYAAANPFRPQVDAFFGDMPRDPVIGLAAFAALIASLAAIFFLSRGDGGGKVRCPRCDGDIGGYAQLVIATRNCPHCGRRVVAEPAPLTAGPPGDAPGSASRNIGAPTAT